MEPKSKRKIVIKLPKQLYSNLQSIIILKLNEIGIFKIRTNSKILNTFIRDIIENELCIEENVNHISTVFEIFFENNGHEMLLDNYKELIIK